VLIDQALPWKLPIPLIEGQGNFGGRGNDPPASAYYTEARLSPAGQVALAAERREIAPVPIGLINGNTHRQGTRPPFRPAAIIEAIRQVLRRPKTTAKQILDIIGPPDFITGCAVTGDLDALLAGQRTELGLQTRITITDAAHVYTKAAKQAARTNNSPPDVPRNAGQPVLVLDNFPPYVNTDDIAISIGKRAREYLWKNRHPELGQQTVLPIKYLADESTSYDYWFVCVPDDSTPAEVLRDKLLRVHGVTDYVSAGLPRPLATMIKTWTRTHQHEDLDASLTALENALPSHRNG
jgi:DNA gyrase/topoisomerase IV subunit A